MPSAARWALPTLGRTVRELLVPWHARSPLGAAFDAAIRGHPAARTAMPLAESGVGARSILRWHEWPQPGEASPVSSLLEPIVKQQLSPRFRCDVRDIEVLLSAESGLERHSTLDGYALARCAELRLAASEQLLERLLGGLHEVPVDIRPFGTLARFSWDGRLCLLDASSTTRFLCIRFLARATGRPVPMVGTLREYVLDGDALERLSRQVTVFALDRVFLYTSLLPIMRRSDARYLIQDLPTHFGDSCKDPASVSKLLVLDRRVRDSRQLADCLRSSGFCDVLAQLRSS